MIILKKYNQKKHKFNFLKYLETVVLTILTLSFFVLLYCIFISLNADKVWENSASQANYNTIKLSSEKKIEESQYDENLTANIIEKANNSVVGISKIKNKGSTIFLKDSASSLGLGTGFFVTNNGFIITNEHVSGDKNSTCYITLENGRSYEGKVVWADENVDTSIVKIDINNTEFLNLGNSDDMKIANDVYAIGNPIGFEFQRTVTRGIISGLNRTIKIEETDKTSYMEDLLQTDATINPGNSGGPLINRKGEVIGINTVKITSAEGIGFAIPINIVKPIINNLKADGNYEQATLGVFAYDKNILPYINEELGKDVSLENGIYVAQIVKRSPADLAGLKEGDILLEIDSQNLSKMSELREYIYSKKPGDEITIKYLRNKKESTVTVNLSKI